MAIDYCSTDPLGSFDTIRCPKDDLVGGMPAGLFLEDGHGITNPSDAAQINAALLAGTAHRVLRCSFTIDAPTPDETESDVPCESANITNYTRKGAYVNPNVTPNNIEQHDKLFDGRTFAGAILAQCGKEGVIEKVSWINSPLKLKGGLIIPKGNKEMQRFEGELDWSSMKNPSMWNVPVGIF